MILLEYILGVGLATAGPPLVGINSTPQIDSGHSTFLESIVIGAATLLPVSVPIHYANEYADVETDALTERTSFSGGSGALERTGLPRAFLRTAVLGSSVAAAVVVAITAPLELPLDAVALLVTIFGLGLAYSLPPFAFVHRGVGEVDNAVLGGLLLPLYGVAVVASPEPAAAVAVVPFTLVVGCNLLASHWPDRDADETVGKRTVTVRWSPARTRRGFTVLAGLAIFAGAILWINNVVLTTVAVAHLVPIPFLLWGRAVLTRQRSPLPAVLAITSTVAW
ncbi:prenyltransferase [Natrarchaeobius sp. A-rgal3]|uniref:prenyltransferase n=1 Tax=Natrarchaeobius versutus TaxID=1679078 RepID=UPI00350EF244